MKINKPLSILALVGMILYASLMFASFKSDPESFKEEGAGAARTKAQIAAAAVRYLESVKPLQSPKTFVTYRTHKSFSGYLQQQDLYRDYEDRYGERYPLDYFTVEIVDSATASHYEVDVNMRNGNILGWSDLNAGRRGPAAPADDIAALYIQKQGYDPRQFRIVHIANQPAGRTTFESTTESIGDSRLQLLVDVRGGEVTGFRPVFSVPDSYLHWFDKQDETAARLTWISMGCTVVMALFSIVFTIRYRKNIRFSRGALLSLVFLLIYVTNNINMYPAFKATQGAEMTGIFGILFMVFLNFVTLLLTASLYLSLISGLAMWQRLGWNPWPHWTEERFGGEVLRGMGRGYLLAFFILGVQQLLFYIAETQFHVWSVNDAADSVWNMFSPALFPLMAWVAGISEEATFRLFGIVFFKKLLRSNFLAVLVPSMIWALSHTQYPIYPVYTRFAEVTVLGLIFGYAFLRYGFITAVFAHTAMDSILMGMSLMFMGTASGMASGAFYMVLPALVGYVIYAVHSRRRRRKARGLLPEALG